MSKKTEETIVEFGKEGSKGKQINIAEEFERVTAIVGKIREAVTTIKDSDISIENWHFAVDKKEKEYAVDFTLKLTVIPREMQCGTEI